MSGWVGRVETTYTEAQFEARYPGFKWPSSVTLRTLEQAGIIDTRRDLGASWHHVTVLDEDRLNALHAAELLLKQGGDATQTAEFIKRSIADRLNQFVGSKWDASAQRQMKNVLQSELQDLQDQGALDGWEIQNEATPEQAADGEEGLRIRFKQHGKVQDMQLAFNSSVKK